MSSAEEFLTSRIVEDLQECLTSRKVENKNVQQKDCRQNLLERVVMVRNLKEKVSSVSPEKTKNEKHHEVDVVVKGKKTEDFDWEALDHTSCRKVEDLLKSA